MLLKSITLSAIFVNFFFANSAFAEQNRCFVKTDGSWYISLYAGTSIHSYASEEVAKNSGWNLDKTLENLKDLQEAGLCPQSSDPNKLNCVIYNNTAYNNIVGLKIPGDVWSYDITTAGNTKEAIEIAKKLKDMGQCENIVLGF
ncbi:MAG: hypothetical protein K2X39_03960 [Silvanigrellaceae bacterium]|nr:hypothetical protein [Silvanigrellaceae bacterium]